MQTGYTYRSTDGRLYLEADTLSGIKHKIRQYRPCTTRFHARATYQDCFGARGWHITSMSPHTIGPVYEGILRDYTN